jgi:hypothetical protein
MSAYAPSMPRPNPMGSIFIILAALLLAAGVLAVEAYNHHAAWAHPGDTNAGYRCLGNTGTPKRFFTEIMPNGDKVFHLLCQDGFGLHDYMVNSRNPAEGKFVNRNYDSIDALVRRLDDQLRRYGTRSLNGQSTWSNLKLDTLVQKWPKVAQAFDEALEYGKWYVQNFK